MDTAFAFVNRLRFNESETYRHFDFAAHQKRNRRRTRRGIELLKKSPYKDHVETAQLFLQILHNRSKDIPT